MSLHQLLLLPAELAIADEAKKRTHRNDPITSLLAAREMVESGGLSGQRQRVLEALRKHPGLTSDELAHASSGAGRDRFVFARRLPELVELGFAVQGAKRKSAMSGRMGVTWWPTGGAS